jgi:Holliday junction resolvase-like predicted endonuclease
MKTSWQVATSAEAFAAAQFARCGWDISVQYGANQPEYDLVAVNEDRVMKISVKGSKDGAWGLTQSYLANADYQAAVDAWLARHSKKTVFCFVQFAGTSLSEMPRMYLASPSEIGKWLKSAVGGRGSTVLYEHKVWSKRAVAAGREDKIPEVWAFTETRIAELAGAAEKI